jgi:UDP-glucose 4-epimerase
MLKRALVTGGSGFIGKYFLLSLKNNLSHLQLFLGRSKSSLSWSITDCSIIDIDLSLPVTAEIEVDIVFHLAGEKRDEFKMWDINYLGTKKLLEWSVNHGVKKFVYLSSVGVYGAAKNAGIIKEDTRRSPKNIYEKSKNAAEGLVREYCPAHEMKYVIVQPSNVVGINNDGSYPLLGLIRSIKNGYFSFFGKNSYLLNYIAVQDVVDGITASVDQKADDKTFIINNPITLHNAVDIVATELQVPTPKRLIPEFIGYFSGEIASTITSITGKELPFSKERFNELTNKTVFDGNYITQTLGFSYPTGIITSLRRIVRSYKEKGLL